MSKREEAVRIVASWRALDPELRHHLLCVLKVSSGAEREGLKARARYALTLLYLLRHEDEHRARLLDFLRRYDEELFFVVNVGLTEQDCSVTQQRVERFNFEDPDEQVFIAA